MDSRKYIIFDIETDSIDAKIIRCVCWRVVGEKEKHEITNYEEMKNFFLQENVVFIGHYVKMFDVPVVEKILNIKITSPIWDTLPLSWTLFSERTSHNLNDWGITLGVEKPKIIDYANQKIEEILHRCHEDVEINLRLWNRVVWYLNQLYENWEDAIKYIEYLSYKLDCFAEQATTGITLDAELCKKSLEELEALKQEKTGKLAAAMPKLAIKSVKNPPKNKFKANGEESSIYIKWKEFLKQQSLPETFNEPVEYIHSYEEPNPGSHTQLKDWLFLLGWNPTHFKYVKEEGKKEMRKIPQIKSKTEEGEICESIHLLFEKESALEELNGLFIISHRINVFKGFLRDVKESGKLYQEIGGLSNTLRILHRVIVNLPNEKKLYSENIRRSLVAQNDNFTLIGSDLKAIEDSTKRHYIYPYDPDYVKEQMTEGFDAHVDIGKLAGFITEEEEKFYKWYEKQ